MNSKFSYLTHLFPFFLLVKDQILQTIQLRTILFLRLKHIIGIGFSIVVIGTNFMASFFFPAVQ